MVFLAIKNKSAKLQGTLRLQNWQLENWESQIEILIHPLSIFQIYDIIKNNE